MNRVVVFVDYADTCRSGQETFETSPRRPPREMDPLLLSGGLVGQGGRGDLVEIRVYRAVPDGRVAAEGFSCVLRPMERWSNAGAVVIRRPLRASDGCDSRVGPHQGLAVALAIDLVVGAWRDHYDLAIVVSRDADLASAINAVLDQTWKTVEVASWRSPRRRSLRLSVPGDQVRCHWLDLDTYEQVLDDTDYTQSPTTQSLDP